MQTETIALDLGYAQASPVTVRQWSRATIVLVGCGGTGSWLAPSLARLSLQLIDAGKEISLVFVDHDTIEAVNIPRQNFCHAELGANKAQALAYRYGLAWGLTVEAWAERFEPNSLANISASNNLTLVVGAVDNAAARKAIAEAVHSRNCRQHTGVTSVGTWWIDCGNSEDGGQVLLGAAPHVEDLQGAFALQGMCANLPMPALQRPELLEARPEEAGDAGEVMSCAQIAAANAQSLMVNQAVAAIAADYAMRLLIPGGLGLRKLATYFDLPSGSQRTSYTTPETVAASVGTGTEIFERR